ncbi:hypothetical protein [Reichenbachiella sp.]|uniref:hypothetical protein n=1 Tax=Reichenbachiella sp. TaxID=2184521 RepID=UPI0032981282
MKYFLLYFLISLTTPLAAQVDNIEKISFQSLSRGYFENVVITQDSLIIRKSENRGSVEQTTRRYLTKKEWKSLVRYLSKVILSDIPVLKSPTAKRTYDGARHSSIIIYTTDGSSYEHLFDNEDPNDKLEPLMKCIISIRDRIDGALLD